MGWNSQYEINLFKYNSVAFPTYIMLCNHYIYQVPKHFHHLKRLLLIKHLTFHFPSHTVYLLFNCTPSKFLAFFFLSLKFSFPIIVFCFWASELRAQEGVVKRALDRAETVLSISSSASAQLWFGASSSPCLSLSSPCAK